MTRVLENAGVVITHWHQHDQISLTISYKDKNGVEQSFPVKDLAGPVVT
jgi:hypothetical protein